VVENHPGVPTPEEVQLKKQEAAVSTEEAVKNVEEARG